MTAKASGRVGGGVGVWRLRVFRSFMHAAFVRKSQLAYQDFAPHVLEIPKPSRVPTVRSQATEALQGRTTLVAKHADVD